MSPYARAVSSTPGLIHWWRFGTKNSWSTSGTPYASGQDFLNSAGPTTLGISGTVNIVPGLIPGDTDGAAQLVKSGSGNLKDGDYLIADPQGNECFTHEIWVKLNSIPAVDGCSLGGAWNGTNGWMVFVDAGGQIKLYTGANNWATGYTITANKVLHVVAVFGGPADFKSHLYINGSEVANTSPFGAGGGQIVQTARQYEVGKYNNSSNSDCLDGIIDEHAIYNRMLQPAEIAQHYTAAFMRG
jgi:hypothetical protein